jgi:hypothetical protein
MTRKLCTLALVAGATLFLGVLATAGVGHAAERRAGDATTPNYGSRSGVDTRESTPYRAPDANDYHANYHADYNSNRSDPGREGGDRTDDARRDYRTDPRSDARSVTEFDRQLRSPFTGRR